MGVEKEISVENIDINNNRIIEIEVKHYQKGDVTVSSFSHWDLNEIENSWIEYFKKQQPINISEFCLKKRLTVVSKLQALAR